MLLRLSAHHLAPQRRWLTLLVLLQSASVGSMLWLPALNADLVDQGLARGDMDSIWRYGGQMLAVSALQVCCAVAAAYVGARIAMSVGRDLRTSLFDKVGELSGLQVRGFGIGSLLTRCGSDVQQMQMLVLLTSTLMVTAPMMMVGGIVMALRTDAGLSWLMLAVVPVLGVSIGLLVSRLVPAARAMQSQLDTVGRVIREQLHGLRVVRAFGREQYEIDRFAEANDALTGTARWLGRMMGGLFPLAMLIVNVATVAVIWFGGHRVAAEQMQVGDLMAYLTYLTQILMAVLMASLMLMMVPRASVAAERIGEVLHCRPAVTPPTTAVSLPTRPGGDERPEGSGNGLSIHLADVEVRHPGAEAPVLSGVGFGAAPGERIGIIGSTGAGKTTLLGLVARLLDPTSGRVRLDDVDVRILGPGELHRAVALVPQRSYLFGGTIAENLRFGDPAADDDALWQALAVAQADDLVSELPGGLSAPVAQGGSNFSGGQRQRICIARALVGQPRVLLLDDCLSALDAMTEARLRSSLDDATRGTTVLTVAQRVASIRDCDRILVLQDGRVVGDGNHEALLATCSTYREIADSQRGVEVLA